MRSFMGKLNFIYHKSFTNNELFIKIYLDFFKRYGPIVLEVSTNGTPIVHLYDRQDIEKVLRYPSKYPFRPPTEIVAYYRAKRPDRYASVGITNE